DEAAQQRMDILCLPECFPGGLSFAEPIDGPTITALAQKARQHRMYVIAPIIEERSISHSCGSLLVSRPVPTQSGSGDRCGTSIQPCEGSKPPQCPVKLFNSAVILGRDGRVVGQYDKTHLTQGEMDAGLTPGADQAVFQLDFGKIGLLICYDIYFADPANALGRKGAEIIFFPSVNYGFSEFDCDTQLQAKAIDFGCHVAASNFAPSPTYLPGRCLVHTFIASPEGAIIADASYREGLVSAEVDLDAPRLAVTHEKAQPRPWRAILAEQRRPDLYSLVADLTVRSDWAQKPAEPRTIKLGAVCLPPNPQRDLAAGREAVCNAIAACAKLGADLVCLPENCFAGGALDAQATSVPVATGDGLAVVAGLCLANRLWAVLPIYRQNSHTGRHESVALLFDRQGRLAGQYVKTHLNEFERTRFDLAPGDALPVFQADFGKFGLLLGEDFLQPEAGRALFLQGAEVLCWAGSPMPFFPSARMLKLLTSSRAIDNFAHVVASNFET
ncbi:MAG: carbon-nitrogen hydrolase family protein, partial [Planctomycetes bacterium]|nr:carbon-nitrogen hydrolase family protein [Planctomycetota bacterium]